MISNKNYVFVLLIELAVLFFRKGPKIKCDCAIFQRLLSCPAYA